MERLRFYFYILYLFCSLIVLLFMEKFIDQQQIIIVGASMALLQLFGQMFHNIVKFQ